MQKIIPHLWFDKQAKEAADFYVSAFKNSKITSFSTIKDTPSGDCDIVAFELNGFTFNAISAGPYFTLNPAISFMLNFDPSKGADAEADLNELWKALSEGGKELMALGEYPFSKWYGWIEDRFGVSWQLILTNPDGEDRPFIIPSLLFIGDSNGKAKEASDYYLSVFKDSRRGALAYYPAGMEPQKEGAVMFTDFQLEGQWFTAMDGSGDDHKFAFNEAVSLMVRCDSQEEIDYYWEKLSAVPESEQCGWLKDAFGVSWQIVPTAMDAMMENGTPEQKARVTQAFLQMKKFDIAKLEEAYAGE
ncbi:MAG: VOC family protein [Patescibacteria group bacterium]